MNLKLINTNVILRANNHKTKPECMSIGVLAISLDEVEINYDHSGEYYGSWDNEAKDSTPVINWSCTGQADVYMLNNESVENPEYYTLTNFTEIPKITNIEEIFYESFTNISEGIENEFYPIYFKIEMLDVDTNEVHEIKASEEVLKKYIDEEIKRGYLEQVKGDDKYE